MTKCMKRNWKHLFPFKWKILGFLCYFFSKKQHHFYMIHLFYCNHLSQWQDFHFTKENHQNRNAAQPTTSCRSLFKQFQMTSVQYHYTLSLINVIINNQKNFQMNSSTHNIKTRNKHHLHRPNATKSCFQKSTIYAGIKIFNGYHIIWQSSRMTRKNLEKSYENI